MAIGWKRRNIYIYRSSPSLPSNSTSLSSHAIIYKLFEQLYLKILGCIRGVLRLLDGRRWHGDNVLRWVGGMRVLIRAIHPSISSHQSPSLSRVFYSGVRAPVLLHNYPTTRSNLIQLLMHVPSGVTFKFRRRERRREGTRLSTRHTPITEMGYSDSSTREEGGGDERDFRKGIAIRVC